jgi:hypothetical protein
MAYVPGYKYDIFISYAHLDNERMYDKGWVEYFYKSLEWFLSERTGKMNEIKIWWDNKKLDGTKLFDNTIQEGVQEAAIMISLVSRFYTESEYCKLEMDLFARKCEKEKTGAAVGDRSRMVHVLLQNIPFTEWPSHFSGRTGFPFYIAPDKNKLGDIIRSNSPEFITQMCTLRDAIEDLLNEFKEGQSKPTDRIPINEIFDVPSNKESFTIYFAEVTDSLLTVRKRAITELEKKGYAVITTPPANTLAEHTQNVKSSLAKADLSVHLLDLYPGREIVGEATNTWYPKLEIELAFNSAVPSMIWTPPFNEADIEEEDYKSFLLKLDTGELSAQATELIHDNKSMITQHISDIAEQLKERIKAKNALSASSFEEKTQVLIDTNFEDQMHAWDLGRALLENGIQPLVNPGEKDPTQNINLLTDRMSQVKKLIFYYGNADKDWIKQRMNAALHTAMNNDLPVDDFFVFMVPPEKKSDDVMPKQKFVKINLIDSTNITKEQAMSQLIKQIKGEKV